MNEYIENYRNLANAIIVTVCNDYLRGHISDLTFKHFLEYGSFQKLTDVDPKHFYKIMVEEKKRYAKKERGKCSIYF